MRETKPLYISIMGDSISTLEGYLPEGYSSYYGYRNAYLTGVYAPEDTWWGRVIRHFGAELLVNNAWSGSYVCRPPYCEIESYGCSDARSGGLGAAGLVPDHILVFLGTNDRGAGFPLRGGEPEDLSVIEQAYGVMLDKIHRNYPTATVWCCTYPITACSRDPYFSFPKTRRGEPMENFGATVRAVAEARGCRVIELWDPAETCDTVDGLHPNAEGMAVIARRVIAAMEAELGARADAEEAIR